MTRTLAACEHDFRKFDAERVFCRRCGTFSPSAPEPTRSIPWQWSGWTRWQPFNLTTGTSDTKPPPYTTTATVWDES